MGLPKLAVDVPEDAEDLDPDNRRALAWAMVMRGSTRREAAEATGVSRQTVTKWIDQEARRRRTLVANIDDEVEKLVGQLEAIVQEAWRAHRDLGQGSSAMVGPQYLRLVLDTVKEIGRLRGIEKPGTGGSARKHVEVVVTIGGGAIPAAPTIEAEVVQDAELVAS